MTRVVAHVEAGEAPGKHGRRGNLSLVGQRRQRTHLRSATMVDGRLAPDGVRPDLIVAVQLDGRDPHAPKKKQLAGLFRCHVEIPRFLFSFGKCSKVPRSLYQEPPQQHLVLVEREPNDHQAFRKDNVKPSLATSPLLITPPLKQTPLLPHPGRGQSVDNVGLVSPSPVEPG